VNIQTPHPYYAKLKRTLARAGNLYTVKDILDCLEKNEMQSFVEGDSLALTRIAIYPRAKVVEVLAVVGKLDEARVLHDRVLIFASEVGANVIQAYGRHGWLHDAQRRGWKVIAKNYVYQRDVDP
jgi:hypothetical protein